jgi:hypothetical protein
VDVSDGVSTTLRVTRRQAVAYRLRANNLTRRLPPRSYEQAARYGLQDTGPRDALVGMHARVEACEPDSWEHPSLIQTYSPRAAVYVLPLADFGIFTVGRLPLAPDVRRALDETAEAVCRELAGREVRRNLPRGARDAAASGRIAVRWTTSALYAREVPRPDIDLDEARVELCRRHTHAFGPTTPETFSWWAGVTPADGRETWRLLAHELLPVDFDGLEAWILAADEPLMRSSEPARAVRLLPASDLRLFGQDRTHHFVGPGLHRVSSLHDSFHPHGLLVNGEVAGVWSRRRGQVHVRLGRTLDRATLAAVEAEALALPIPGAQMSVDITDA